MTTLSNVTIGSPVTAPAAVAVAPPAAIAPSPSQAVIADANRVEYTTDANGHRLGVKRINASLRRRVLKALSAESGEKGRLLVMATVACCCVEIDGSPVPFPASELQVEALIDRLEQEGLDAVATVLGTKFAAQEEGEGDPKNS